MFGGDPFANLRRHITAPVHTMRTFQIDQPLDTHYRRATCQEVACRAHAHGWKMGFDLTDPDKRQAARWIRDHSRRTYSHELLDDGRRIVFTFPAGQRCFTKHRLPLEREPFYVVRGGDFRGNPRRERVVHRTADSFVDQWAGDLDQLNTIRERG